MNPVNLYKTVVAFVGPLQSDPVNIFVTDQVQHNVVNQIQVQTGGSTFAERPDIN